MIVRDLKRLALLVGPLVVLLLLTLSLWRSHTDYLASRVGAMFSNDAVAAPSPAVPHRKPTLTAGDTHYEIYSASSPDGKFFEIRFGADVFNPNLVPHQKFNNTWWVVGQLVDAPNRPLGTPMHEVGCMAQFIDGVLMCIDYAHPLPYKPTPGGVCEGNISFYSMNVGPHDARVFFGPQNPITIFGSNSGFTCFGMFIQDFRKLVDWEYELMTNTDFEVETEVKRPPPYSVLEKNYFVFWDKDNVIHVHYDTHPKRGFAKLERDGSTGPELATKTAEHDTKCMQRYLPEIPPPPKEESIHQATNSLKITLCNRVDKACEPHDGNTYIMTIIQHKTFYGFHSEYEPYVVLFQQRAPFELYAISKKPLWISGRRRHEGRRTDMMYVTSANWRDRGVNYHGYLDDVVMLGFGFEDKHSRGIDVYAGDLLVDLGLCEEP